MNRFCEGLCVASTAILCLLSVVGLAAAQEVATIDPERPTVLVTGANRGIGLAFAEHYVAAGWNVLAAVRAPERASDLAALASGYDHLVIEQLDVTDNARIEALAARYSGTPIDVLLNNAGVYGDIETQSWGSLSATTFEQVMAVNVFAPMKLAEAFADHVAASDQKKIVALSSGLGSVAMTGKMPGFYYYRISKTGLNMAMRGLRTDLRDRGIIVALIAPGMVGTQLLADSGWTGKSLTPDESVAGMTQIIAGLTLEDKGTITNTDGKTIPW